MITITQTGLPAATPPPSYWRRQQYCIVLTVYHTVRRFIHKTGKYYYKSSEDAKLMTTFYISDV